jgi:hypothetical protein
MALLFDVIDFPPLSRMTGIWTNSTHDADVGDEVAMAQLIVFPPDQDPVVESDFLCSHLPFHVGGFHGVFPDAQGWMVVLQKAPASASTDLMSASERRWVLVDGVDRALRFNYGAEPQDWAAWDRDHLEAVYEQAGVDPGLITGWSVAELLWGLLAECCSVPLTQVVHGHEHGCAFPDRDHECQGAVFVDVFALWTTRALSGPEPDLDEVFGVAARGDPAPEFTRWTRTRLRKLKRRKLIRMAQADGWDPASLEDLPRKALIAVMIDGQTRPPGMP